MEFPTVNLYLNGALLGEFKIQNAKVPEGHNLRAVSIQYVEDMDSFQVLTASKHTVYLAYSETNRIKRVLTPDSLKRAWEIADQLENLRQAYREERQDLLEELQELGCRLEYLKISDTDVEIEHSEVPGGLIARV